MVERTYPMTSGARENVAAIGRLRAAVNGNGPENDFEGARAADDIKVLLGEYDRIAASPVPVATSPIGQSDVEMLRHLAHGMGFGRTHDMLRRVIDACPYLRAAPPAEPVAWEDIAEALCGVDGNGFFVDLEPGTKRRAYELRAKEVAKLFAAPPAEPGLREALRLLYLWFEQQIENAQQDQISGFASAAPAGNLRGERAHARHCAMYEAQQQVRAALASTRSEP